MQHFCEQILDRRLQGHAQEHIANANKRDPPPAPFLPALLLAERQRKFAMLFDIHSEAGYCAVKEEEAERGEDVEYDSGAERAPELDFGGGMRENERGPLSVRQSCVVIASALY